MATWVAGTEESTIVSDAGALPGRRSATAAAPRQPAGTWHAVDADTGSVACGTNRFLEVWRDRPWDEAGVADRCTTCLAQVPV